jgi:methyl-accepting chemotaxis protein
MLNNVPIRSRLMVGFGTILALLIALTAVGVDRVNQISQNLTRVNEVNSVKQRHAINFRGSVHDRAIELRDVVLFEDEQRVSAAIQTIEDLKSNYAANAGPLDEMMERPGTSAREREILDGIKAIQADTRPLIDQVIDLRQSGDLATANAILLEKARPNFMTWLARINEFIDYQEAQNNTVTAETRRLAGGFQNLMLLLAGTSLVIGGAFAWWVVSGIRPLRRLSDTVRRLSDGDLDAEVTAVQTNDEVGQINSAVKVLKDNAIDADRLRREQADAERRSEEEKRRAMQELADRFEREIGGVVNMVGSAATELQDTSRQLSSAVDATESETSTAATGANQAAGSVQTMASASEELSAAIQEVNTQVANAAGQLRNTAEGARDAETQMDDLIKAVGQIDQVVEQISDVAEQTNLLALNATIEAARAGDAGKGFAVVANEVKSLANQTRQMTDNIAQQLTAVKQASRNAVEGSRKIVGEVETINQTTGAIAASVEQQTATTAEISRSAQEAARGTEAVSGSLASVTSAAGETATASDSVAQAADNLTRQAQGLKTAVDTFLSEVRAA